MDHNPIWEAVRSAGAWWIFSALIQTMPVPRPTDYWYGWLYRFAQAIGANWKLMHETAPPEPAPMVVLKEVPKA